MSQTGISSEPSGAGETFQNFSAVYATCVTSASPGVSSPVLRSAPARPAGIHARRNRGASAPSGAETAGKESSPDVLRAVPSSPAAVAARTSLLPLSARTSHPKPSSRIEANDLMRTAAFVDGGSRAKALSGWKNAGSASAGATAPAPPAVPGFIANAHAPPSLARNSSLGSARNLRSVTPNGNGETFGGKAFSCRTMAQTSMSRRRDSVSSSISPSVMVSKTRNTRRKYSMSTTAA